MAAIIILRHWLPGCVGFHFHGLYQPEAGYHHRWELPGNYPDFIVVMVFYLLCRRTKRILVTSITDFKIYMLIQSLMLFIYENNRVIYFF